MSKLRIHFFQHVPFEGLGSINEWAALSGHSLSSTRFYEGSIMPQLSGFDFLIIMGGPMNVYDEKQYPWLADEKIFIRNAIEAGKIVLGICLGSQLVSAALGARVYQNKDKEIGWYDIELSCFAKYDKLFFDLEEKFTVFHWHGDTFELPLKAIHLAYSRGCNNQAYIYNDKVVALQFHIEPTLDSLKEMIEFGRNELIPGKYVQTEKEILAGQHLIESNKKILFTLLDRLTED